MSDCHCREASSEITERSVLLTLLSINGVMFAAELVASIFADSTGLLADSLDMLADAIVYGAVPIGVAAGLGTRSAWIVAAVLLQLTSGRSPTPTPPPPPAASPPTPEGAAL